MRRKVVFTYTQDGSWLEGLSTNELKDLQCLNQQVNRFKKVT